MSVTFCKYSLLHISAVVCYEGILSIVVEDDVEDFNNRARH